MLTDQLTCPRCGPEAGLVVLADEMSDRRIVQGRYGCPACKSDYAIVDGVADLRIEAGAHWDRLSQDDNGADRALRTAALLGVGSGHGIVLVIGAAPEMVEEVARLLPNALVVGAGNSPPTRTAGSGWMLVSDILPFRSGSLRGVAIIDQDVPESTIDEALRVLWRESRLVLDPAGSSTAEDLRNKGLGVLLNQDGVLVASAPGAG
jgi:uncharacterized protein YbaR (Trm112 family)